MAKASKASDEKEPVTVEDLTAQLAEEQKEREVLEKKLAEALAARSAPVKGPDGEKYTKPAPAGQAGSDGQGNLVKYVKNKDVAAQLESEGWKKAA